MVYSRKNIIIGVVAVAVIGLIIWFFVGGKPPTNEQPGTTVNKTSSAPVTREAPPANVVVPSLGATNVPEGVAVPQTVSQASVNDASVSLRSFDIKAQNNQFAPDTVIVKQGDKIDINIAAVDKDYAFTQPRSERAHV